MNRDRLDALYRAAEYRVDHPGQPFVLHVDRPCPEPAKTLACSDGAAFLTACNPRGVELPDAENRARNRRLAAQLGALATCVLPGVGRSPDGRWEEPSFLAIGLRFDQAMTLAREHAQIAFLWIGDDGLVRLVGRTRAATAPLRRPATEPSLSPSRALDSGQVPATSGGAKLAAHPVGSQAMRRSATLAVLLASPALTGVALGAPGALPLPLTPRDFAVAGTQVGDVPAERLRSANECNGCHGGFEPSSDPYSTWAGSLMALGGRDPLFFAQMTLANQDVQEVGSYCIRCHVPNAVTTGHVEPADGSALDAADREGVACYFCHTMVDPVYTPGTSPVDDESILQALAQPPAFTGNAMFVLDTEDRRRGPRPDPHAYHQTRYSPYHRSSALCGTCHDVGNVATTRQPDGSYRYNAVGEPAPDADPWTQFPLERTYTEWKLSAFGQGGVDMGGRFGGVRGPVVSSCQDCHMPATSGRAASFGPVRADLARHDFAGAAAPSLDLIAAHTAGDPAVDQAAIATGRQRAIDMLQRAASVELRMEGEVLVARVTNHAGHKLPTGHIEGRRAWLNVRYFDPVGALLAENGAYDADAAELDATTTTVYEMLVGLSEEAAAATGLPAGPSNHMALADTIVKDSRIPPRGFDNAMFEAGGAPAMGIAYADGQYWHEQQLSPPPGTARVEATLYYQSLPRSYIEHLRDANVTDQWGNTLHALWVQTGRGAPIAMASAGLDTRADVFADGFETLP